MRSYGSETRTGQTDESGAYLINIPSGFVGTISASADGYFYNSAAIYQMVNTGQTYSASPIRLDPRPAETAIVKGYIYTTSGDPPVPELSTLILMSSGLVAGIGMLAYSSRKKKAK